MKRQLYLTLIFTLLASAFSLPVLAQANLSLFGEGHRSLFLSSLLTPDTDRDRDGLAGPVRRVKTEMVKLSNKGGKVVEEQRVVLESLAYDIKGTKIENAYFPIPGAALTGKEVYKYDDKGNIVEMTLMGADGSLLSKEVYAYEFDARRRHGRRQDFFRADGSHLSHDQLLLGRSDSRQDESGLCADACSNIRR